MIPPVVEPGDVLQRLRMPNAAGVVGKSMRVVSVSGDTAQIEWVDAVYTSGTYANPAWITELASTKITGTLTKLQQHAQTAYYDAAGTWAQAQVFQGATFNGNVSCPQATDGERFGSGGSVANYSTSVGKNATCTTNGVAVGAASSAAHTGVAVGWSSIAGSGATALGTQATAIGTTIAIGYQATTTNLWAVALGNVAEAAFYSTALGYATKAPYSYSIALGAHAENTGNNQLTIGSPTAPISQITFPGSNNVTIVNPVTFNGNVGIGGAAQARLDVTDGYIRVKSGAGTLPASGKGLEMTFDAIGNIGYVLAYNRDSSTYYPLHLGNDALRLAADKSATFNGTVTSTSTGKLGDFTVATLPSASAYAGHECNVTDSSVTTFGSTVAGGGSSRVKLYSNGTNWTVQAV